MWRMANNVEDSLTIRTTVGWVEPLPSDTQAERCSGRREVEHELPALVGADGRHGSLSVGVWIGIKIGGSETQFWAHSIACWHPEHLNPLTKYPCAQSRRDQTPHHTSSTSLGAVQQGALPNGVHCITQPYVVCSV